MFWSALGRAWWGGAREEGSASLDEEEDASEEWLRGQLRSSSDMILGRERTLENYIALGVHTYSGAAIVYVFIVALSRGIFLVAHFTSYIII